MWRNVLYFIALFAFFFPLRKRPYYNTVPFLATTTDRQPFNLINLPINFNQQYYNLGIQLYTNDNLGIKLKIVLSHGKKISKAGQRREKINTPGKTRKTKWRLNNPNDSGLGDRWGRGKNNNKNGRLTVGKQKQT